MPRPLGSFKGKKRAKPFSFSLSEEYEDIIREAERRAFIEGCNRSDIILVALKEYFRMHDEPNPQTQLPVKRSLSETYSLNRALKRMEGLMERWKRDKDKGKSSEMRVETLRQLEENLERMASVYDRTKDEKLKAYVEEAMKILKGEGRL